MSKRILVVEDQDTCLDIYQNTIFPQVFPPNVNYDLAVCYDQAREKVLGNQYRLVLLDHRLPRKDIFDLQKTDFMAFCRQMEQIGYGLIALIREKSPLAVIVGTSSLKESELVKFGKPDYSIQKSEVMETIKALDEICRKEKIFWE